MALQNICRISQWKKWECWYITLQIVIAEVSELVCKSKDDYYKQLARKLKNPITSSKRCWPILKTFYNGRKVPLIPPIVINNKSEADFKRKADHFNNVFASKCTQLKNDNVYLPYLNMNLMPGSPKLIFLMTKNWKFFGLLILTKLMDMIKYQSEC